MITNAAVPIAIPIEEIAEIIFITLCDFLAKRYLLAMNSGRFNLLEILSGLEAEGYTDEVIGLECCSADEAAVYVGHCEEFLGVRGLAASAVED